MQKQHLRDIPESFNKLELAYFHLDPKKGNFLYLIKIILQSSHQYLICNFFSSFPFGFTSVKTSCPFGSVCVRLPVRSVPLLLGFLSVRFHGCQASCQFGFANLLHFAGQSAPINSEVGGVTVQIIKTDTENDQVTWCQEKQKIKCLKGSSNTNLFSDVQISSVPLHRFLSDLGVKNSLCVNMWAKAPAHNLQNISIHCNNLTEIYFTHTKVL